MHHRRSLRTLSEYLSSEQVRHRLPQGQIRQTSLKPEPAHDNIFWPFVSSLNPDDSSVTWIIAGALDFLRPLEGDGRLFELGAFTSPTATDPNDIQCNSKIVYRKRSR